MYRMRNNLRIFLVVASGLLLLTEEIFVVCTLLLNQSVWLLLLMMLIRDDLCGFLCFLVRCLMDDQRRLSTQNSTTTATRTSFLRTSHQTLKMREKMMTLFLSWLENSSYFLAQVLTTRGCQENQVLSFSRRISEEERRRSLDRSSTRLEAKDASGVTNEIRRREVLVERVSCVSQKSLLLRLKLQWKGRKKKETDVILTVFKFAFYRRIERIICPLLSFFRWTFLRASTKTITHPSYASSVLILCREGKILVELYWERKRVTSKKWVLKRAQ